MHIDGVEIFVEKLPGVGKMHFVLIHNAGADHRFFTYQIEMLRKFGSVVWFDLPGSGKSQSSARYHMEDASSIVAKICRQLALEHICLIGLNNGANIAIDSTLHQSIQVEKLILIDPPIFLEQAFAFEIQAYIENLESAQLNHDVVKAFVDQLFLNTDACNKDIAEQAFMGSNPKALAEMFRGLLTWDSQSKGILKKISCPTLCILTDGHHCSYEKMHLEAPHFEIGKVVGSKCWATLEVPEQINAMISRFLKISS